MTINWASLISAPTASEAFVKLIGLAKMAGFPTTSWATKAVPRVILQLVSQAIEEYGSVVTGIAQSAWRTTATGGWLDLVASEVFGISRNPATYTIVKATLNNAGISPHTIGAGDIYISAGGGLLYRNSAGGTLPAGGALAMTWQAERAGTAYNLDAESLEGLVTPLAGVTVTVDPGLGWIVTQGVDEEPDDALRVRCGEQWSTLGAAGSSDAYAYNCKAASSEVTRVRVYEATPVPGWVTCYLAGPAGPVTGTVATAVRTWFEVNGRRPQCVGLIIDPAGTQTIDVTGTVNVKSGLMATAKAAIATAFEEIQAGTDFGGVVDQAEIIAAVRTARGVVHLDISTPAEDVTLAASQLAVLVDGLTYVEV